MDSDPGFYPEHTAPKALDIVWGAFPHFEEPDSPGPKHRPCLVQNLQIKDDKVWVDVVPGTSNMSRQGTRGLYIANPDDMAECQLRYATLFDLGRVVTLPWAKIYFLPRKGHSTPIIGRLNQRSIDQLRMIEQFRPETRRR